MNFRRNRFPSSPSSFFQVEAHDVKVKTGQKVDGTLVVSNQSFFFKKYALLNIGSFPQGRTGWTFKDTIFETT